METAGDSDDDETIVDEETDDFAELIRVMEGVRGWRRARGLENYEADVPK